MCGIIGYIGTKNAVPIVVEGLKKLEYRGYDSVGIAVMRDGNIYVRKASGKLDEVSKKLNFLELNGNLAIGHTRWATHGGVNDVNAHPHVSNSGNIVVVHNGIIENYQFLKKMLEEKGFTFKTQTDTEVIPNLIEYWIREGKNFREACIKAFEMLEGSYAVLILNKNSEEMIAGRKSSPLVLGVADHGFFAASDIPAFLKHTKKVIYLNDYDVAFMTKNSLSVYNMLKKGFSDKKIHTIDLSDSSVEKGSFEHFMLKEILEQVDTIKKASQQDEKLLKKISNLVKNSNRVWFIGSGTSYHASLAGKYMFSKIAGIHSDAIISSEFPNFINTVSKNDIVISISQSGETADVLQAVKLAKERGLKIVSIVNVEGSSLTRISDFVLPMKAGPEIGVAATKTYTAELVILSLLAHALVNKINEGKKEVDYIQNVIYNLTAETTQRVISDLAEKIKYKPSIFTIGRGLDYVSALETALKIKEISYIHAEAFPGGELKHGPIALIENGTPVIVFSSKENEKLILSNAEEVKSRGAYLIGVSKERNKIFDYWIKVPENKFLNTVTQIIPMQILAYRLAVLRGFDPDKPRNLAKSVTVI